MSETDKPATPAPAPAPAPAAAPAPAPAPAPAAAPATPAPRPAAPAAAPAGAAPSAPAAARPAAPAKPASPLPPRQDVVYSGIAALPIEDIVVPFVHVARGGDTLASLAKDYYGDRSKAGKIADANKDVLGEKGEPQPGQKLKIPKG